MIKRERNVDEGLKRDVFEKTDRQTETVIENLRSEKRDGNIGVFKPSLISVVAELLGR